ncbi:general secretion pathway protein GspK [Prosthecobacter sp.]|uniref:general secretion pathway protein GspK n=1 Tax=Prosthecobacter sp. TaxID=1965333 RepID=UPI0037836396
MAVLSFLVITTVALSQQHALMQEARYGMMRARQLAEMGVAVAAHPQVTAGDPLLRRSLSQMERFEVILSTEESRMNLNLLLTEERLPVLERMLKSWGMLPADAQALTAILMDWTDADDLKRRPDSAEKFDYDQLGFSDRPLNRKFGSLNEVDLIARVEEIYAVRPDWRSYFTLRGSGQLDVNMASAEVLAAATGASLENAVQLVQKRIGPDGLQQTEDDLPLQSLDEAVALLGIAGSQAADIIPLLTLQGPTLRIESIGTAGDARCGISVIVHKNGGMPVIAEWSEFPVRGGRQL